MKILTGFAVLNDRNGKRITYTYDVVDEMGSVTESNNKESYIVLDEETKSAISALEQLVENRMKEM
jgi:hypothetical protein